MKYIFSECQEIARKNAQRHGSPSLLNYTKSTKTKTIISKNYSKSKRKEFNHCKDCGVVLKNKSVRLWGFCAMCINQ